MTGIGYWVEPRVLPGADCDAVLASVVDARRSRAGVRHLMSNPTVATFANDDRLITIARAAVGAGAIPFRATLFEKTGERNWLIAWHQDTALPLESKFDEPGWGPWSEKGGVIYAHAPASALSRVIALRVSLDASTSDNGPLRVIPDSPFDRVVSDDVVAQIVSTREAVDVTCPRGGVIAMRPLIIHASSKAISDAPRRVLHIEYAESLCLTEFARLGVV
jgi:ectoine hydroxylase-related dioxygenase (phytanoyl-CoA dioxygenase family)